MKAFTEYLKEGVVKKVTPDKERAQSLKQEAKRKFTTLGKYIEFVGIDDDNANDYVEYCYNIILYLIRAEMYMQGYKSSGVGAHEAEVAFTINLNFTQTETNFLNSLRYFRNGILYYGKQFDYEYAKKVIEFTKKVFTKIK